MSARIEKGSYYQRPELQVVPAGFNQPSARKYEEGSPLLRKRSRETVGSEAFNLEYDSPPTPAELKRDIVSYLSEYRLQIQKYPYQLIFGRQSDGRGSITLRDQDRGASLSRKAQRAIASRTLKEQPIRREEAELEGIGLLNDQLRFSQTGDTVFWASPPGPKEQGYGDYGFLYVGRVTKSPNNEASVAMQAIRIEKPTLDQYSAAFSDFIGEGVAFQNAESFLARPRLVHQEFSEQTIDTILQKHFSFVPNEEERKRADKIIQKMDRMLEDFIEVMQTGTRAERIKAFYALENYALKHKKEALETNDEKVIFINSYRGKIRLNDILDKYSHRPPATGGSCGSSGGKASSNGLSSISGSENVANGVFGSDDKGDRTFHCPECNALNMRPYNGFLTNCQSCGSEKVAC